MDDSLHTRCCIVGGGPAGMVLALLLARAGVDVVVMEKHGDFLRDFRGDTVHPSTLQVMADLGLLDTFLKRPHDVARTLHFTLGGERLAIADFTRLHTVCPYIALMPQWEFLDFLRDEAAKYPNFRLLLDTEAISLSFDRFAANGRMSGVSGVQARTPEGPITVYCDLAVACDGRHSNMRFAAGLQVEDLGAPIDVLWMRLPRKEGDPEAVGGYVAAGQLLVAIDRGTYWQCAYVIAKGGIDAIKDAGLPAFQSRVAAVAPFLADRVSGIASWDDVKLLTVTVDRLRKWWRPGLVCIGDAAHAMSPVGGVGINLAVQDAVATANILAAALADPTRDTASLSPLLRKLQRRRLLPARITQAVQVMVQDRILAPVLARGMDASDTAPAFRVPGVLRLLSRMPFLQKLPAYAVGIGVRPERVHSPPSS